MFENISTFPILEDIRNDVVVQKAIISLSKRLCESENIRLESLVQDVKSLHPEDTNLSEAKRLIEIIRLANLNATSVISFIWAEDFTTEPRKCDNHAYDRDRRCLQCQKYSMSNRKH